jgi:hypothetical protein
MRYVQAIGTTFTRHLSAFEPRIFSENVTTRPRDLTPDEATLFGVHKLQLVTPPFHNPLTQTRTDGDALLVDGVWKQNWVIANLPAAEAAVALSTEKDRIRTLRNDLLDASDWTQINDSTADKAAWATYRQALRDIPTQNGFPFTIEWPTSP